MPDMRAGNLKTRSLTMIIPDMSPEEYEAAYNAIALKMCQARRGSKELDKISNDLHQLMLHAQSILPQT